MGEQEEELELGIWDAMRRLDVTCSNPDLFVDLILVAARHYAAGDSAIVTELRMEMLRRDGWWDVNPTGQG